MKQCRVLGYSLYIQQRCFEFGMIRLNEENPGDRVRAQSIIPTFLMDSNNVKQTIIS